MSPSDAVCPQSCGWWALGDISVILRHYWSISSSLIRALTLSHEPDIRSGKLKLLRKL